MIFTLNVEIQKTISKNSNLVVTLIDCPVTNSKPIFSVWFFQPLLINLCIISNQYWQILNLRRQRFKRFDFIYSKSPSGFIVRFEDCGSISHLHLSIRIYLFTFIIKYWPSNSWYKSSIKSALLKIKKWGKGPRTPKKLKNHLQFQIWNTSFLNFGQNVSWIPNYATNFLNSWIFGQKSADSLILWIMRARLSRTWCK